MYLAAEGMHVFCRNATEACLHECSTPCSLVQMSSSLVPPLCSLVPSFSSPDPSALHTSGFPMIRFYSQHLTQRFWLPILNLLHHESLEEGFNNVSQCWFISTLTTILLYPMYSFSTRRFWSRFADKYFKIEKRPEKKNYRGV